MNADLKVNYVNEFCKYYKKNNLEPSHYNFTRFVLIKCEQPIKYVGLSLGRHHTLYIV